MRTILLVLISAVLAIMLSCVETTSVEAPVEVDPSISFEVTVNTELTVQHGGDEWGELAVLVPTAWSVDSVICDGYGYIGPFNAPYPDSLGWAEYYYPSSAGYQWWHSRSPQSNLYGDSAETGYAIVTISTNDTLGTFQMAFLAAMWEGMGAPYYEGDPCSCTVTVTPLNLQQETWGYIKAGF